MIVKNKTEYDESLFKINESERLKKRLSKMQKEIENIKCQLDKCA